jgi:hypothetical protein
VARNGTLVTGVLKLQRAFGTIVVDRIGQARQAGDVVVMVGNQAGHRRSSRLRIRCGSADDNQPNSALGNLAVMKNISFAD